MRLLCAILLLAFVSAKYIQVPAAINYEPLSLRLQQLHRVASVFERFGPLKRIFKKEVYRIDNGNEVDFPTCYEEMPFATLEGVNSLRISSGNNTYGLVYDFEKVKNRRNLIDIEMTKNSIFYATEDGNLQHVSVAEESLKLSLMKMFKTQESKITKGNIVIWPNATAGKTVGFGLFINHNQAVLFDLQAKNFIQAQGFKAMKDFQSAVAIGDSYLAVAYGQQGVVLYSIDFASNKLSVEATFDQSSLELKTANFKDLAYDKSRRLLFMLDHNSGVLSLELSFGSRLQAQLTSSVIKNSFCNLIYYDSFTEELYLNCRELIKYQISKWPILDERVLPRQDIAIRSMSSSGGSVVLAGRNVLEIIAQERKVAVYQDKLLEKFMLRDSIFLSANENYLLVGTYQEVPPEISCQSSDGQLAGNHLLLFKVTAECNQAYFKTIGFEPGAVLGDDKCVYSVYQSVAFWQPKQVDIRIFMVILGAIGVLGLILLVWWGLSKLKLNKLRNYVQRYQTLEEEHSEKPRKDPFANEVSPGSGLPKGNTNNEVHEKEVDADLHDIE